MEVLLKDFLADQLLGLNGLVNLANFAFLLALSVRHVLWLRVLSFASDVLVLPYYYFQHEPLWPPISGAWHSSSSTVSRTRWISLVPPMGQLVRSESATAYQKHMPLWQGDVRFGSKADITD
jgi:hypothetical protein